MRRSAQFILSFALCLLIKPALAQEQRFGWPLACTQGSDCWVVHHVDVDVAKNTTKDFQCGHLTYDGHDGTDIAVRDLKSMATGMSVLSVDAGIVVGGRGHVPDGSGTAAEMSAVRRSGQECGNGVLIKHQDGWETQYCHLKKDSVKLKAGDHVEKGALIGMVGQSGMAEFPHLHFTVRHQGVVIDPYSGAAASAGCDVTAGAHALWDRLVPYDPVMFYAAGFSVEAPQYEALLVDAATIETVPASSPSLVFWFMIYGAQKDDRLSFSITDPSGAVFSESHATQEKDQIRIFRFIGKKAKVPLQAGIYKGRATLTRDMGGKPPIVRVVERRITVQ